jgi:hypothetical protein
MKLKVNVWTGHQENINRNESGPANYSVGCKYSEIPAIISKSTNIRLAGPDSFLFIFSWWPVQTTYSFKLGYHLVTHAMFGFKPCSFICMMPTAYSGFSREI